MIDAFSAFCIEEALASSILRSVRFLMSEVVLLESITKLVATDLQKFSGPCLISVSSVYSRVSLEAAPRSAVVLGRALEALH